MQLYAYIQIYMHEYIESYVTPGDHDIRSRDVLWITLHSYSRGSRDY